MKHSTFIQHQAKYILCTLAMLVSFVGTAWGDGATIGNTDNTSTWWSAFSDYTTLEKGKTVRFSFNNFGKGTDNWANWDLVAAYSERDSEDYTEYFVLRADKYGWGTYYNGDGFSLTGEEDGYYKALHGTYGARVYMTVTFTSDYKIKVIAQTTENDKNGDLTNNTYTYTFTSKALPNAVSEIKLFHVADHCHIEDYTVSDPYNATETHTINFDADYGTGATMPDPVSLYEGYTYVFPDLDPKPTKFGQTFYGWNDGNVWKAVGYQYTMGAKDVTLKASYYVNHTNSVNFNSNDAIIGTLKEPISGQSILLPAGYSSYEDITSSTSWTGTQGTETSTSYSGISGYQALYYNTPTTGDVMHQELTGLANGTYEVIMSVAASYTQGNGTTDGKAGNNLTYAFAGEKEISIPVLDRTWVNSGDQNIVALVAEVTDGTLNFGLRSKIASGNWYVIKVESLRRITDTGGFTGWYNESGTRVGGAGDSYSIQNDEETLYAHWAIGRTIEYNTSSKYVYSNAGNDKITVSQEDGKEYTANGKTQYYKTTSGTNINDKCYLNKSTNTKTYVTAYDPDIYVGAKIDIAEGYMLKATAVNVRLAVENNFVYRVVINNGTEDVYTSDDKTISDYNKTSATNLDFTAALSNLTLNEGSSYIRVYYWLPGCSSNKYLAPLEISIEGTVQERPRTELTTFAWSKASDKIIRGGAFTSPTFSATDATTTYSKENANLSTVATFNSDNEAVATVANDGTVTLTGGLGTAKITATVTSDYKTDASPATYTITVNGVEYKVTYDLNDHGASTAPSEQKVNEESNFTTASTPTRFGYTFKGWKNGDDTYEAGATVTMPSSDITLTAQWELTGVKTISLNGNGNTLAGLTSISEPFAGQNIVLPMGYTSDGVTSKTAGTWINNAGSEAGEIPDWGKLYDKNFREYYYWKKTAAGANLLTQSINVENGTYEVILKVGASWTGGDGFICPVGNNLTVAFAQDKTISIPVIDRNGNTIAESQLQTVAFTVTVTDGTLTYGLKNIAESGNWFVARVESIKQLTDIAVRKFSGWNTKADGTGTLYAAGSSYTATVGETLYAQWNTSKYKVTFDGNGGTPNETSLTEATACGGIVLPTATPASGYTFVGWTTTQHSANEEGVEYLASGSTYYPTEDCTLYAYYITAGNFIYTINAVDNNNNIIKTLQTGELSEETIKYFPKAFELDGKYYVTNETTFGVKLNNTNKTANIKYAVDNRMAAFTEEAYTSVSNEANFSNGGYGFVVGQNVNCRGIDMGTLKPGKYSLNANIISREDLTIALRDVTGKSNTETADIITSITSSGFPSVDFNLNSDTQLRINGKDDGIKSTYSANFDYAYIEHVDGYLFLEQPVGTNCLVGDAVTLKTSVVAYFNGYVNPSYQWYSNTTNSTVGGTAIEGATKDTYTFNAPDSKLYYYCVVSYGDNSEATDIVLVEANPECFSSRNVTAALTDWTNPTNAYNGSSNVVSYASGDTNIAWVNSTTGEVRMISDGTTKITATLENGRTVFYNLTITANEGAIKFANGKEGTMNTIGKLYAENITEIDNITLTIGNGSECRVIRQRAGQSNKESMVLNSIDGTTVPTIVDNIPTNGTFYKFTPSANGILSVYGYSDVNTTVYIKTFNGNEPTVVASGAINIKTQAGLSNIELRNGETYYVYSENATFYMRLFSFQVGYKFANKAIVASEDKLTDKENPSWTQYPVDPTTSEASTATFDWSVRPEGELEGVSDQISVNQTTGEVKWPKGYGGAIVVFAKEKNGTYEMHYVITVPYTTHTWSFRETQWEKMQSNTTLWATTYKVRQYDTETGKILEYINVPVISNAVDVDGDNAYFISSTAGLLITSTAKQFGYEATMPDDGTMSLVDKLNRPYIQAKDAKYLTMTKSKITIPNLTAGYHIRIRWKRYTKNSGDTFYASNVTDLDGKSITSWFNVGNFPLGQASQEKGLEKSYDEFIVESDGDVSFTNTDKGWTHICEIQVAKDFIDTDYRVVDLEGTVYETDENGNYPDIYVPQGTSTFINSFSSVYGQVQTMSALETKYYAEGVTGRKRGITVSMTEDGVLTINALKNGQIEVTQKGYSNGYVLDINKQIFNVHVEGDAWIEQTFTQQYPFSWDFTNISGETYTKLSDASKVDDDNVPLEDWTTWSSYNDATDKYYVNRIVDDFIQGAALSISKEEDYERLEEFQGLGVKSYCSNQIRVSQNGNGLEFEKLEAQVPSIVIPTVLTDYKVFIRGRWLKNVKDGTFTVTDPTDGNHTLTVDQMFENPFGTDNEQIYVISDCNGNDIEVAIDGFQIRKIGVTGSLKKMNEYKGASYATDCQDYNVKYDLSSYFTNGLYPVTASIIKSTDEDVANFTEISIAPEATGTILKTTSVNSTGSDNNAGISTKSIPLFVRDVNSTENSDDGNMLIGVTEPTEIKVTSGQIPYIFTNVYYDCDKDFTATGQKKTGELAFYRLLTDRTQTIGANKAYLVVNSGSSQATKKVYYLWNLFDDDEYTDIKQQENNIKFSSEDEIFNLQGIKIDNPTNKGIYIVNGKKVVIK